MSTPSAIVAQPHHVAVAALHDRGTESERGGVSEHRPGEKQTARPS
jgi:hypothetical protein